MWLYRVLTDLGAPAIALVLRRRRAKGREDPARFPERLGYASAARPAGKLVWCHAASVGEAMSVLSLAKALRRAYPHWSILLTTGTVTSAQLLASRLPPGVFHQYVPVDRWAYVTRFLDHWRPDLALWVESELWPNMLTALRRRAVPAVLLNGRMSEKSFRQWSFVKSWARELLGAFALGLAQTEVERQRFAALGLRDMRYVGNLKFAAEPLPCDEAELRRLKAQIGGRKVWVMASTHPGEEQIALDAHQMLRRRWPDLLTIIVPRHAERGGAIKALLQNPPPLGGGLGGGSLDARPDASALAETTPHLTSPSRGEELGRDSGRGQSGTLQSPPPLGGGLGGGSVDARPDASVHAETTPHLTSPSRGEELGGDSGRRQSSTLQSPPPLGGGLGGGSVDARPATSVHAEATPHLTSPSRGEELEEGFRGSLPLEGRVGEGVRDVCVRRSQHQDITPATQIYLADTMGELGLFYRLASVTCLGGSFTWGGHNPVEPAQLGCAMVFGPCMPNFAEIAADLVQHNAALQVAAPDELATALARLLAAPEEAAALAAAARAVAERQSHVLDATLRLLDPWLAQEKTP